MNLALAAATALTGGAAGEAAAGVKGAKYAKTIGRAQEFIRAARGGEEAIAAAKAAETTAEGLKVAETTGEAVRGLSAADKALEGKTLTGAGRKLSELRTAAGESILERSEGRVGQFGARLAQGTGKEAPVRMAGQSDRAYEAQMNTWRAQRTLARKK